jgi:ABC-type Fe3+-siderophore transport system permease subunit
MKYSTKRNLAALSALVLSGYLGFVAITELSKGNLGYFLFGFCFAIGMAATLLVLVIFKNQLMESSTIHRYYLVGYHH